MVHIYFSKSYCSLLKRKTSIFSYISLFFRRISEYLQAKQCVSHVYLHAIPDRDVKFYGFFSHENSGSSRTTKKSKKKIPNIQRKGLTRQSCHVSMPLGGVHGMWSHQLSVLHLPGTLSSKQASKQANFFVFVAPSSLPIRSSPFIFTPPIRTRFVQWGE